jgi:hypothetical protein
VFEGFVMDYDNLNSLDLKNEWYYLYENNEKRSIFEYVLILGGVRVYFKGLYN